jgi:hypothetical protein
MGLLLLLAMPVRAQEVTPDPEEPETPVVTPEEPEPDSIAIGGHVYGGGNVGNVAGSTRVTVYEGNLNNVFGGARLANVGGRTFVHVDGKNASDDIFINTVYGGNDIAGKIGQGTAVTTVPTELENTVSAATSDKTKNVIDTSWKTFIRTSSPAKKAFTIGTGDNAQNMTADEHMMVIGSLFGGGNGDYYYGTPESTTDTETGVTTYTYTIKELKKDGTGGATIATKSITDQNILPELSKTYLEIKGGCIAHVYGGGNNATVTDATVINIDNESSDLQTDAALWAQKNDKTLLEVLGYLQAKTKLSTFQSNLTSYAFNHARIYGGNNKATMSIMPTWNLQRGIIRDVYSGGNEGDMTSSIGLLLDIDPATENKEKLEIYNVYGGCRRADVRPLLAGSTTPTPSDQIQLPLDMTDKNNRPYHFPAGLPARTLIRGGKITNVYGGNDVSGRVFGGNAVGIYSNIIGDVYGGGNGSYAYTDNPTLGAMDDYKDFYYNPDTVKKREIAYGNTTFDYSSTDPGIKSVEALNIFRPNAEQVSLRLAGTDADHPVIIGGSVYVGGNSATLKTDNSSSNSEPMVHLKIGSYVTADKVFLGNNGEKMVDASTNGILSMYANDNFTVGETDYGKFSQMTLTNDTQFKTYMDGCAMTVKPNVVFDLKINETTGDPATYVDYSTAFGSFFCGGNVGSMKFAGSNTINFNHKLIIFDKLVGGSNNAFVPQTTYNAAYDGGILLPPDATTGNKLVLNLSDLKLMPQRWKVERVDGDYKTKKTDAKGNYTYLLDANGNRQLEWNVISSATQQEVDPVITGDAADLDRRLFGGNVYGGCCESGHVNGNVVININSSIVDRDGDHGVFDSATPVATANDPTPDSDIHYGHEQYTISTRRSGVILSEQGMDVLGSALNVFGGGKGKHTEIWGSTTVNLKKGYAFQIFGGSEEGVIGKDVAIHEGNEENIISSSCSFDDDGYPVSNYTYNEKYSTTINVHGTEPGCSTADIAKKTDTEKATMAECEFVYGGAFEGLICGNTRVNLGNGRVFNVFTGSCNADILGHTETYFGQWQTGTGESATTVTGFPWVRDHTYGGNDLGGRIIGVKDFQDRVRSDLLSQGQLHNPANKATPDVLKASSYVEYVQGRVGNIFGGSFGDYDYDDPMYSSRIDHTDGRTGRAELDHAFVNIRPSNETVGSSSSRISKVFGGSQGASGDRVGDKAQKSSYVLIDIPQSMDNFASTEIFGSGDNSGMGMRELVNPFSATEAQLEDVSSVIDLVRGEVKAAYGGSYNEGVTRRTVVNVPTLSTIKIENIFGGAYGTQILPPCDVYESHVNYNNISEQAIVTGAVYGGNNNERRTLFTQVNISSPVWSNKAKGYLAKAYGAGKGVDTWAEHTEVNLNDGAKVYEVYGGGEMGHVLNAESVQTYMQLFQEKPSTQISTDDPTWSQADKWEGGTVGGTLKSSEVANWKKDWKDAWTLGEYYGPNADYTNYITHPYTNLNHLDDRSELTGSVADQFPATKFNANVIINEGAEVVNYAYGGGWGKSAVERSGDVYGTTYIALLGGKVKKDIYAAGTAGGVYDLFGSKNFTASANAFIMGGTARNVYGGGWEGGVGKHTKVVTKDGKQVEVNAGITDPFTSDIYGETNVVIGRTNEEIAADSLELHDNSITKHSFYYGRPAIQRNAYGGGEGGAVYGTAKVTLNNGYIGYQFNPALTDDSQTTDIDERYEEKIEDETYHVDADGHFESNRNLYDSGCVFGGGYIDDSNVDNTLIKMYGGHVRNSLFGGGEIAAIGRGVITASGTNNTKRELSGIYKAGKTKIEMYEGHVHRNVFGGGRGYNNLGERGTLFSDGYVFGQTEVNIHGGEIGTLAGLALDYGNVFGGGDVGYVYSAYEYQDGSTTKLGRGIKSGVRYDNGKEGYYYRHKISDGGTFTVDADFETDNGEYIPTEDCKVLIEPWTKVVGDDGVAISTSGDIEDESTTTHYSKGEYVPTAMLNYLKNKTGDPRWAALDSAGIKIHNAVFAGGNTSAGSTAAYANATSVYGNATASIHDVYHRDLITLGTGHIGGLYGDGNLTFVDGYRGLNITNYGTDYYYITKEIDISTYDALPEREAAYYELKYKCKLPCTDKDGTRYNPASGETKASTITMDDMMVVFMEDKTHSVRVDGDGNRVTSGSGGTAILIEGTGVDAGKWTPNPDYWEKNGVLPVYAGRLMNSIQRADFCGVFGSRMVLQGAQDRVPEIVDFTNYTINRVREVSLNQQHSKIASDLTLKAGKSKVLTNFPNDQHPDDFADLNKAIHGNYFGIYNIVNYLGALTSDVHFMKGTDVRRTDNTSNEALYKSAIKVDEDSCAYGSAGATYYNWKAAHVNDRSRNNGCSLNKVALASGVYLELTTEKSTGDGLYEKDWGPITGVVELDLINVQPGIGGGFVYAKNEHGIPTYDKKRHATLTALNQDAITRKDFTYTTNDDTKEKWQTSGNFVHSTQTIIDDCYNISSKYKTDYKAPGGVPAHYWFIKGSVYVYDQYISAYTGAPNAYSETVEIPLTITAASHGTMKLLNVQQNRYAYYATPDQPLEGDSKVNINDVTYSKNDPISYWDYYLLSNSEKNLFVEKTYVVVDSCKLGDTFYPEGYVMLPKEYKDLRAVAVRNNHQTTTGEPAVQKATVDASGASVVVTDEDGKAVYEAFDFAFRESNNVRHDTGYLLTYKVNNPKEWNTWYTPKNSSNGDKINYEAYDSLATATTNNKLGKDAYWNGPTYRLKSDNGEVLGQQEYKVGNLIPEDVYKTYEGDNTNTTQYPGIKSHVTTASNGIQATFGPAYLVTKQFTVTDATGTHHMNPGSTVSATVAGSHTESTSPAYICTSTIQLSTTEFIYVDTKMTEDEKNTYYNRFNKTEATDAEKKIAEEIDKNIVPAYYCLTEGNYGGNYYESGKNYRGLEAWSSMSPTDRQKFTFNYDALDLLIDSLYGKNAQGTVIYPEGQKYEYDGPDYKSEAGVKGEVQGIAGNPAGYSVTIPVDYSATYNGTDKDSTEVSTGKKYKSTTVVTGGKIYVGDELSREQYESLPNEQRHYSPVTPKSTDGYKVYVVKESFQIGNSPYAAGQTISASEYSSLTDQSKVTVLHFTEDDAGKTFYYCRMGYTPKSSVVNAAGVTATVGGTTTSCTKTYDSSTDSGDVPEGLVIAKTTYDGLDNDQAGFTIHGISPTEQSTLYVSRNSDIYDLTKEKIITVIYQYDYEEVDNSGGVTPISERHVVNIHLTFKSGIPEIEDIKRPDIVIPGDLLGMREPNVKPGAYEVMGGGWELFERISDAENHTNGIDYVPDANPLYWYQDDWYVAYYAKTYLGKTYSNAVPVSVANYHDLKKVMDAKQHHYYIDNPDVKRDPKIYINDYSGSSENGLDLFKNLYDLSVLNSPTLENDTITTGTFKGHKPLNTQVRAGRNLEFFLHTDIDHSQKPNPAYNPENPGDTPATIADPWTSIGGTGSDCFAGTLHGEGHHLSGLSSSLFDHLCGDVYNLGVSGTFTGAGIAENGSGYVENCWTSTTSTAAKGTGPVFGNPVRTSEEIAERGEIQIVNCYYEEEADAANKYTNHSGNYGIPTKMPKQAFYNGEVAYNLNGFYLYKRYSDQQTTSGKAYTYWKPGATTPQTAYYGSSDGTLCSSGSNTNAKYVEDRYKYEDFLYADGTIPEEANARFYNDEEKGVSGYYPIWPDDYIFFGQALNYDQVEGRSHQDYPTSVNRSGDRIATDAASNRVYRAPAYFRSSEMGVAHFNPYAVFAKNKYNDASVLAYKDMTAIDFTGHNDTDYAYAKGWQQWSKTSQTPQATQKSTAAYAFYPPLLDDDGLSDLRLSDFRGGQDAELTKNLLVYTFAKGGTGDGETPTAGQQTANVVSSYLNEYTYQEDDSKYRNVERQDAQLIHGHWVAQKAAGLYGSENDHLLIDRQDFNAPMAYTFDTGKRMWHQRRPDSFVDRTKGWEAISLPFTAELVTTDQKGEITHFFSGSDESKNGTNTKIGHEYWLRRLTSTPMELKSGETKVLKATFSYPTTTDGSVLFNKSGEDEVSNTFLWDYYYEGESHNQKDRNKDIYQEYYRYSRSYNNYPLLSAATPYLLGLPGATYYEFDLSGTWGENTDLTTSDTRPAKLDKQTITFASIPGTTIQVSDGEMTGSKTTYSNKDYYFKPNYLNMDFTAKAAGTFVMNSDGNAYHELSTDAVTNTTNKVTPTLEAFRPYFIEPVAAGLSREATRSIIFSDDAAEINMPHEEKAADDDPGTFIVRGGKKKIVVESALRQPTDVRILNTAGITLNSFTIQPGETVETRVNISGVYIVQTADRLYTKKLEVK